MPRPLRAAVVALAVALPAAAPAAAGLPQPIYFWGSTAALVTDANGNPASDNPLVISPSSILMFQDGAWVLDNLQWSDWGSSVAHATGISSASDGIPDIATGKRTSDPAQVTLTNPGQFHGHEVYRCFQLTIPSYPASNEHLCLTRDAPGLWGLFPVKTHPRHAAKTSATFYSPSRNLNCEMNDGRAGVHDGVFCESFNHPHSVHLTPSGRMKVCRGGTITTTRCLGNPGEHTPVLPYGRTVSLAHFRCISRRSGIKCVVKSTGKGFLIDSAGVTAVG